MEEVKAYLGHSTIRVSSDRYGHLFPEARDALALGLDETFRRTLTLTDSRLVVTRPSATYLRPTVPRSGGSTPARGHLLKAPIGGFGTLAVVEERFL